MDQCETQTAPGAKDVADQIGAIEAITILRENGHGDVVSLLEEGKPLTPKQMAIRLRISEAEAARKLQDARDLLTAKRIHLPAAAVEAKPKPRPKPKKKKKPAPPARSHKPAMMKATIKETIPAPAQKQSSAGSLAWLSDLRETIAALQAGAIALMKWAPRIKRAVAALQTS